MDVHFPKQMNKLSHLKTRQPYLKTEKHALARAYISNLAHPCSWI